MSGSKGSPPSQRNSHGLSLRASFIQMITPANGRSESPNELAKPVSLRFPAHVRAILWHLLESRCDKDDLSFLLDVLETMLHRISITYKPEYEPKRVYAYGPAWRLTTVSSLITFLRATNTASAGSALEGALAALLGVAAMV